MKTTTAIPLLIIGAFSLNTGATLIQQSAGITTDPGLSVSGATVAQNTSRALNTAAFTTAGLYDAGSSTVGGGTVAGTLYYAFTGRSLDREGNVFPAPYTQTIPDRPSTAFAAGQINRGGTEVLGVGNAWTNWGSGVFGTVTAQNDFVARFDPSPQYAATFLVQIDFVAGGDDTVTVQAFLDGNTFAAPVTTGDASFDTWLFRSGHNSTTVNNRWEYSDVAFATTASEALNAIAVPEPGSIALVGLGLLALIGIRKRR